MSDKTQHPDLSTPNAQSKDKSPQPRPSTAPTASTAKDTVSSPQAVAHASRFLSPISGSALQYPPGHTLSQALGMTLGQILAQDSGQVSEQSGHTTWTGSSANYEIGYASCSMQSILNAPAQACGQHLYQPQAQAQAQILSQAQAQVIAQATAQGSAHAAQLTIERLAIGLGITLEMKGNQAYTNGKHVVLPNFALSRPYTTLAAKALLAHEVGHIWFSDFGVLADELPALMKLIFNVLEDIRVDFLMGEYSKECQSSLELFNGFVLENLINSDLCTFPKLKTVACFILSQGRSLIKHSQASDSVSHFFQHELEILLGQDSVKRLLEALYPISTCDSSQHAMHMARELYGVLSKSSFFTHDFSRFAVN